MFNLIAYANAAEEAEANMPGLLSQMMPMILIFAVFYIFMIRPQVKKQQDHQRMIKAIAKGDEVVTAGGLVGVVKKVDTDNNQLEVELSPGVVVKAIANTINKVTDVNKTKVAADNSKAGRVAKAKASIKSSKSAKKTTEKTAKK